VPRGTLAVVLNLLLVLLYIFSLPLVAPEHDLSVVQARKKDELEQKLVQRPRSSLAVMHFVKEPSNSC
jgi:hypothetical protein